MASDYKDLKVLFDLHYQNLCYFVYTLTSDKALAEDLVQDAFVSLHNHIGTLNPNDKVYKSYLYTSVKHSVLNHYRRSRVEKKYHEKEPFLDFLDSDFDNALIKAEVIQEINKLLMELPESCQNIMHLHYIKGLSMKEIADQLEVSINTVKTQKLRGIRYIKSKLNPEFFVLLFFLTKI